MALSQRIKDIHSVVAPHIVGRGIDTYDVLALLSALDDFIDGEVKRDVEAAHRLAVNDPARVAAILAGSDVAIAYLVLDRKIQAIKEVRSLAKCGLKEAKDACDAFRVPTNFPQVYRDGVISRWWNGQEVREDNRPLDQFPPF